MPGCPERVREIAGRNRLDKRPLQTGDDVIDQVALRELKEETGVSNVYLEQRYSLGNPYWTPHGSATSDLQSSAHGVGDWLVPPEWPLLRCAHRSGL